MDKERARKLIGFFEERFDEDRYCEFIVNLLDNIDTTKQQSFGNAYVKESFNKYIKSYKRVGQYTDLENNVMDILSVHLFDTCSLDRNRTLLRNFVAEYMKQRGDKKHILVAFYSDNRDDWRFSYVKKELSLTQNEKGNVKVVEDFTSAKRCSFLVGKGEYNHTAQEKMIKLLMQDKPLISDVEEAFNVEKVSKEFFTNYKELFLQLVENLKEIRENEPDQRINHEFVVKSITEANFCKKLLGQLVFLYFIQKKGWLGVDKTEKWGNGDKHFLRHTFERAVREGKNFFNDYLEPLFYEALANGDRDEHIFPLLDCKIPFLNGGLFEPIGNYNWVETDIVFDNERFSNREKTKNGDVGTGILDVFERYNFTVKEDEPLEKEVAVDPEMLGKVFEELLEVNDRKSKGAFYTPREIVHYMCQESLINYLCTELDAVEEKSHSELVSDENRHSELVSVEDRHSELVSVEDRHSELVSESHALTKQDIAFFIHHSDKLSQKESIATQKENENKNSVYQHQVSASIRKNAERIDKALENIKICDPAIGSGAFPVGMMNEIVRARLSLVESGFLSQLKKRTPYELKRQAIQNSIYGVDIESGAVDIAKLRLWLSLIVDEEDIENIKALPNLDYKIVCANSLLDLKGVIIPTHLQTRFNELVDLLFDETVKQKKKTYQKELDKIKEEVFKIANSLGNYATFDYSFFFHEVFKQGGFDIVIANPPYIGEKGHKEIFEEVKKYSLKEYYLGKMDYFYFFFHLALNILKENGACAFITTNYYITAQGARLLRKDFKYRAILKVLVNFNELKIFETALGQHNLITILQKGHNLDAPCRLINVNRKGYLDNSFYNIVYGKDEETTYNTIPQSELYDGEENYIRISKEDENSELSVILNKIKANNDLLGNICNVNQGIVTGCDKVTDKHIKLFNISPNKKDSGIFVINNDEYYNLFNNLDSIVNVFKPWFKNSDILKYNTNNKNNEYLLYLDRKKQQVNEYPQIQKHLNDYIDIIKKSSSNSPYLHRPRKKQIFEFPKIVAPQRSKTNTFGYNECEWYASADVYFITEPKFEYQLKYILSLLNSKLYYIWLYNKGKRKGESLELYQKPLSEIPIKKADIETQNKFVSVVDKILEITQSEGYLENKEKQQAVKEYEKQIDLMVYKLYDLTYDEVLTIDQDFTMTEQEYNGYKL